MRFLAPILALIALTGCVNIPEPSPNELKAHFALEKTLREAGPRPGEAVLYIFAQDGAGISSVVVDNSPRLTAWKDSFLAYCLQPGEHKIELRNSSPFILDRVEFLKVDAGKVYAREIRASNSRGLEIFAVHNEAIRELAGTRTLMPSPRWVYSYEDYKYSAVRCRDAS